MFKENIKVDIAQQVFVNARFHRVHLHRLFTLATGKSGQRWKLEATLESRGQQKVETCLGRSRKILIPGMDVSNFLSLQSPMDLSF